MKVDHSFFERDSLICSQDLIEATLTFNGLSGVVVETEAYRAEGDPACHTFFRKKAREFVATHRAGTAYVYLNYGVHWMLNFLCQGEFGPGFVLIRALAPTEGLATMRQRRNKTADHDLCSGPGKLTQALGLTGEWHGVDLLGREQIFSIILPEETPEVLADRRIGITKGVEFPWRFTSAEGQQWVSRRWKEDLND